MAASLCSAQGQKHRAFILTDVENEPDDSESLVRLMLYSDCIDIEGIVATTSVHMQTSTHPETIHRIIDAYGKVRDNLVKHSSGFPDASYLHSVVHSGPVEYGMKALAKGKTSEGTEALIKAIKSKDKRPLYVSAWGGVNTLAQALFILSNKSSKKELASLISKIRVYTISDQDDSGIWIRRNFPDLFFIVSPGTYDNATWSGIMDTEGDALYKEYISNSWLSENIQQGKGPLGACYPDVAYGMEGDTPSWLALIPNGLNDPERPDWGSWGGRYEYYLPTEIPDKGFNGGVPVEDEPHAIWTNAEDAVYDYTPGEYGKAVVRGRVPVKGFKATLWRWRADFQNDFAARMDWCLKSYEEANHSPVITECPEKLTVKSGSFVEMEAQATDPDGDSVSYLWFNYPEAGTYDRYIPIGSAENIHKVNFRAPRVEKEETLHFILKVTDKGTPALTSYRRIIVTVQP